jgi:ABC-2 type transport system ATP-binding protein
MNIVNITDVVKRYSNKISVDHMQLKITEGDIFGLVGPNGAGKSTTIKMICGLLTIDSGEIIVDGISVAKNPLAVKKKIGLVPQELAIYENLSAKENVSFFAKLYGLRGNLLAERTEEALSFVGLLDRQNERPQTFSGGMKRRLNIACAIMHHPQLIIMDEPTVGIDPQSRNHILDAVKQLNKLGSTIIYTSHYMEEVEAICSHVAIMDHGHLIACGTKEELIKQVAQEEKLTIEAVKVQEAVIAELNQHPQIKRVQVTDNTIEIYLQAAQPILQDILFILSKHQVDIHSLTRMEPDLETLFLSLTGRTLRD